MNALHCVTCKLRRLEGQGLLTSDWNTDESRPRKFYRTTEEGLVLAKTLRADWAALTVAITELDEGDHS